MTELPDKDKTTQVVKTTAIGTAAVGALVLQVLVFRAVGDVMTSVVLFGLGYAAAKLNIKPW